jgi:predicted dehydrogenase
MQTSRRIFLQQLAAGAIAAPLLSRELVAQAQTQNAAPKDVVRHASFGCSGMAWVDIQSLALHPSLKVVAGCDVDANRTAEFRKKFPEARIYSDYRELLDKEKDLHSVNVSTPDHMHAPIAMAAMQRGLHIYGQKPLAHNLHEVRRMTEYAQQNRIVTQMGIQIHSNTCYRTAVATIQKGVIGRIKEVHTWSNKKWGDNGALPDRVDPVPAGLDWNQWLGVAAERPYINGVYHPGNWRKRLDFGTGTFGDMGCHIYDPVFNALALTAPISVRSEGAAPNAHSWATDAIIHYVFPGTAFTEETVRVTWYDGDQRPPVEIQAQARPKGAALDDPRYRMAAQGSIFIGTKGVMVLPHVSMPKLYGEGISDADVQKLGNLDHWGQFVDAVLGKGTTGAHFGYSGPLTEAVLLGSVASRFPKTTLQWDAKTMTFPNTPEANQFVKRVYRKGWEVKGL